MNSIKYSIYFLLVIAKNTKPLLPFSPNLSIYLSGMQLAVHILLSGLDYDEPLRDIRGGGGGVYRCVWRTGISLPLLYTAGGLLSQPIAGQLQCPYPKIVVLIQQIC